MANWRMSPPPVGNRTFAFDGRSYTCALGAVIDVPDFDGPELRANGWILVGLVGTTAQRPLASQWPAGIINYVDTTLGQLIYFDGQTYRRFSGVAA
jgi:hypothetical protein